MPSRSSRPRRFTLLGTSALVTGLATLLCGDALILVLCLFYELFSVLFMATLALAAIPIVILSTLWLYAHGPAFGLVAWYAGASGKASVALGLLVTVLIALGPRAASLAWHEVYEARMNLPAQLGTPPRDAPRTLRLEVVEEDARGRVLEAPRCEPLYQQLLLGDELEALEVRAGGRSVVYRRVNDASCPPWADGDLPEGLERWHAVGTCIVAEPGGTLPDAPRLSFTRRRVAGVPAHLARFWVVAERGPEAAPTWRRVVLGRHLLIAPTAFFVVPTKKRNDRVALGLARWPTRVPTLQDVLRDDMGYRLERLAPPKPSPFGRVAHHLAKAGPLDDRQLSDIGTALRSCTRSCVVDEAVLAAVVADERMNHAALGGLDTLARHHPDSMRPHVEALLAMAEERTREVEDRAAATWTLGLLPPPMLRPHAERIARLADPAEARVARGLLPVVGRLGVDPTDLLRRGLADPDGEGFVWAAKGFCNADPPWAPPLLDDGEAALNHTEMDAAQRVLLRGLARHGRTEAVERYLAKVDAKRAAFLRRELARAVDEPPGGCR